VLSAQRFAADVAKIGKDEKILPFGTNANRQVISGRSLEPEQSESGIGEVTGRESIGPLRITSRRELDSESPMAKLTALRHGIDLLL